MQTVSRGWGDCKDKAAVIVAMLNELGVDATMVLVRTGHRGRFRSEVASLAPFDHAIAYVPELDLYLDGTAEFTGSRELPAMDQGALALQVNAGSAKLVTLPDNDPKTHVKRRVVSMRLSSSGNAELELAYTTSGASAAAWRQRYAGEATRRARVLEDLGQEFPGIDIPSNGLSLNDVSNYEEPVSLRVRAKAPHLWREEGGTLSLRVTPRERLAPLYASLARRRLDVDLGAVAALEERHEIVLPAGYEVKSAPASTQQTTPFGSYSLELVQEPGKVVIESHVSLAVSRVSPEGYAKFREFCLAADAAFEARLVLGARAQ